MLLPPNCTLGHLQIIRFNSIPLRVKVNTKITRDQLYFFYVIQHMTLELHNSLFHLLKRMNNPTPNENHEWFAGLC